ncbi:acyl-CoA-dependent ceramide synthase [Kwoniella heveanensis CBS 569]|uniref:Acyl-CoA-dependent ceramide synthase n=1 Tax=Kwoniella heveanensis BCC8398 TaxID=1296120 RepID=A0A1B9GWH8_9TREE|nr:acyl-CoA-dependent ceramide synthase [Kwoniella heveanensis BCC8398]OCF44689.1 acyl-CoA-dependent ceramide synthase [Kwoniella heveanensis CBS 569]
MTYNLTLSTYSSWVHAYLPERTHPFVLLSYPIPYHPTPSQSFKQQQRIYPIGTHTLYDKGWKDVYFSIFWAIAFTILRAVFMRFVFAPFVRLISGRPPKGDGREQRKERKRRKHVITRFSEQAWSWLYCSIFWTLGVVTLYQVPSPTSPQQLWGTYPYSPLPALNKFYYLAQLGWWFHQLYVISTEKRRKDHWQMFGHHWLTITLIVSSYVANFTRVGVVVHSLLDFCDIFLPLAKMIRYLGYTTACDITFVIFLVSWLLTRQIGLFLVIKTSYFDAPKYISFKWHPASGHYLTYGTYLGFCGMLAVLWVLASVWFYMACRVAVRVVRGLGAEDSRSDDEDEGEDGEEVEGNEGEIKVRVNGDMDALKDVPESVGTASNIGGAVDGDAGGLKKRR